MTRGHPSQFTDKAQAELLKPVWLVELYTGLSSPNDILRYANAELDIVFPDGGATYARRGFGFGVIEIQPESAATCTLVLGDDGTLAALVAQWEQKEVRLLRVHRDLTGLATYAQIDTYIVRKARPGTGTFTLELQQRRSVLEQTVPRRLVHTEEFPGVRGAF